ncbi:hypothetical protein RCO28_00005 [Streptomyces sp. LHD-70]|uniref:hypothetical protein n=1 Tax=Streptomyces sp. LHD-70 TaxID=3072140 RepID=UPI00280D634D|nr:hypothetical protein [Streptomyces sp. LHD-70]MDQ8700876.1 hypothetical protein [Streptomyces sp. LHD-70]
MRMRTSRISPRSPRSRRSPRSPRSPRFPRSGLFVAAVAAPLALVASPALAASGPLVVPTQINVTATGTTVQVTTTSCPSGGRASLMGNGSASFTGGEQVDLAGGGTSKSASWQGVSPGSYTVAVICTGGASAGAQRVTVSSPTATSSPTTRPTSPTGQVRGGLGGGAPQDTAVRIAGGAALALTAGLGGAWLIRRRRSRGGHS